MSDCTAKTTDVHGTQISYQRAAGLPWRYGSQVQRTLYARDPDGVERMVGVMDSPALAGRVVADHNDALALATADSSPRGFRLLRAQDVSGVSGEGYVALGFYWAADQVAILQWYGPWPTWNLHARGMESVEAIHGHDGATTVEWAEGDWEVPPEVSLLHRVAARMLSLHEDG